MGLTMKDKKSVVKEIASRYQRAKKKLKGVILDEFEALTGYVRCYASYLLRNHGRKVLVNNNTLLIGDVSRKHKRQRQRIYDQKVFIAIKKIWQIMDYICGKRLAPALKELIFKLEQYQEIQIDRETKEKLLKISPATIDRLLAGERKKQQIKGRSNTKPGTLLKNQIPIKTFSEWNEQIHGFVEIDLVGHDGGNSSGEFAQTLNVTDICTGWTELQAVKNKAQVWVFEALTDIQNRLPFKLLGIDSDNGSEFINDHLYRYCIREKITFTRARSYRKNDSCYVEQKNYSVVRRTAGYMRYDTEEELRILNELYKYLGHYTNFFQPAMKMIEKTRTGSKVKKKYDKPQTPYQRALQSPHVSREDKERIKRQYALLNPAELKRQIIRLQNKLIELVSLKETVRKQNLRPNRNTCLRATHRQNGRKHKDIEYAFCEAANAAVTDLQLRHKNVHKRGNGTIAK